MKLGEVEHLFKLALVYGCHDSEINSGSSSGFEIFSNACHSNLKRFFFQLSDIKILLEFFWHAVESSHCEEALTEEG